MHSTHTVGRVERYGNSRSTTFVVQPGSVRSNCSIVLSTQYPQLLELQYCVVHAHPQKNDIESAMPCCVAHDDSK